MKITIKPIGIIHTPYTTKEGCPIQPLFSSSATGFIELASEYEAGLKDIETFSHLYLLYALDRAGEIEMARPTFLDDEPHGIFASRHPARPNGIGLSIVKFVSRKDNIITVEGVDILDNTPLLDIKPYLPKYDSIASASDGWTENKQWRPKPSGRE